MNPRSSALVRAVRVSVFAAKLLIYLLGSRIILTFVS